jgi:antitoxin HicB
MAKMQVKQTEYAIMVEPLSVADGGGWLATVPALPGCMGDGETPEAALADAESAITAWHEAARELVRDIPGPATLGQWRQRVPGSLHEKLKYVLRVKVFPSMLMWQMCWRKVWGGADRDRAVSNHNVC